MESRQSRFTMKKLGHSVLATAMLFGVLATVQVAESDRAEAALPPISPAPGHVTADALPTVQINGVVYDQYVLGNTVYAVGKFTSARPAGSASGVNEVPRSNMLAYNLTTGELIASFNPVFNGQLQTVTASPDGSRIYVGGLFTNVSGEAKYSLAALNPVTGSVISAFTPFVGYKVNDIVATNTTVYAGGEFQNAGDGLNSTRLRLAAFSAANGSLLTWAPAANANVNAMVMSPKGDRLIVGGAFDKINDQSAKGLAAIDPNTGALLSWPVDQIVHDYGKESSILTLSTDGKSIFGGGWVWNMTQGNLEGLFSADPDTGAVNWVNDCHGDTYSSAAVNGYVYTASHSHLCNNIGSFPQSATWADNMRHALSYETDAKGTVGRDQASYESFEGQPAPSQAHWYPQWAIGTATGQNQATWSVAGDNNYVVYGGEFPAVNGIPQQGLVRFAVRGIAPVKERPWLVSPDYKIKLASTATGQVRVTIPANYDRDSHELNYSIVRDGVSVYQTRVASTFWDQPMVSYTDKSVTPGQTYSYQVRVTDDDGNLSFSNVDSIKVASSGAPSAYSDEVMKDGARLHWRLGSVSGSTTADAIGTENGAVASASRVSFGGAGALTGDSDGAATFQNNIGSTVASPTQVVAPNKFSTELWVKVANGYSSGGRLAGFGSASGSSKSYDRVLYMTNDGRITFGVYTKVEGTAGGRAMQARTIQSGNGLNNGQWHHVVATLGDDGMNLYIDGVRSASRADTTSGDLYYARFRVGADTLSNWPSRPSRDYLTGSIDEAALYYSVLSPTQIAEHYRLSGRTPALKPVPSDSYGAAVQASNPYLYYRLEETTGTAAADSGIRVNNGVYSGSTTRNQSGVLPGTKAVQFNGSGTVAAGGSLPSPGDFSTETWFKTTSTTGGQLIGFGSSQTGLSSISDRMVYMRNDGTLAFVAGVGTVATTNAYNNGQWHHVVATQGQDGMRLYVDGVEVGSAPVYVGLGSVSLGNRLVGYWRIGGDKVPSGATSNYFNGLIDEVSVYDRAVPGAEVLDHFSRAGGQLPNVPPVAAFSATGSFLQLNLDGSASNDPDGSIVSYQWDFGDGSTATGPTASHTYLANGVYTVKLTVTDDRGGVGTKSQDFQVNAPIPNVPPVASFTSTVAALKVIVDGTASSDADGTIQSFNWDFGDGASASGNTASHTYATAGTYQVKLTVTDNDGGTDSVTHPVVVTEPTGPVVHASDAFERTETNGWGSAAVGGAWTWDGGAASLYSVSNGAGHQQLNVPGRATGTVLGSVAAKNVTLSTDLSFDKPVIAGGVTSAISVRKIGSSEYRARLWITATGTDIMIERSINGAWTTLGYTNVPGLVLAANDAWRFQFDANGTSPTTLTTKVWRKAASEPMQPQLTVTDSSAVLQNAGAISTYNYLSGLATNAPVTVTYDNLLAITGGDVPVPNVPPVAAYSSSALGLDVNFDAGASTDSDGVVASYAWDFGDGSTGSGRNVAHTYATAGTYQVKLTVTDDQGASASVTHAVVVTQPSGPQVRASDTFERSESNGWGTADVGGVWSWDGGAASLYSVVNGRGQQELNVPGRATGTVLGSVAAKNVSFGTDLSFDKPVVAGGVSSAISVRKIGSSEYRARLWITATGTDIMIERSINGAWTTLGYANVPGLVLAANDTWRFQLEATGTSPTTISTKVWNKAGTEPVSPLLSVTDSSAALQNPGAISTYNYLSGLATNAPVKVSYDNVSLLATAED